MVDDGVQVKYPTDFQFGSDFEVTSEMKQSFDANGFIIIRGLFDKEEITKISKSLTEYQLVENHSFAVPDKTGRAPRVMLWNQPGNDVTGMVPRTEKVVTTLEKLMGGDELYHYHTKIMMKDPKKGGSFEWHQDYGYWYKNGCLAPDLISLFLAVDPCIQENGGLQVLAESHHCGRVDHQFSGGQQGADIERVELIKKRCPLVYINLQPGDALMFHCLLLHSSGPNDSAQRRWAFNCAFNKKTNNPVKKHHHPFYTKLEKVSNTAVKDCNNFTDFTGKEFMDSTTDKTIRLDTKDKGSVETSQ